MKLILLTTGLLSLAYLYVLSTIMPEGNKLFNYSADSNYLMHQQVVSLFIVILMALFLVRFKNTITLEKLSISFFCISTILLGSMFILPNSVVPVIEVKKLYINVGGISISPMLFYVLSVVLLVSYLYEKLSVTKLSITIISLMGFSAFFTLSFYDYGNFLLLEILLLSLLVYIGGFNKYTGGIIGVVVIGFMYVLLSPHRIARIENWFNVTSISKENNPLDMGVLTLLDIQFSSIAVVILILVYLGLINMLMKIFLSVATNKILPFGVVSLLLISLCLNILNFFHILPISPTPLFFFDYGLSVTIVSYIFIGVLSLGYIKK